MTLDTTMAATSAVSLSFVGLPNVGTEGGSDTITLQLNGTITAPMDVEVYSSDNTEAQIGTNVNGDGTSSAVITIPAGTGTVGNLHPQLPERCVARSVRPDRVPVRQPGRRHDHDSAGVDGTAAS